MDAFEIAKKQRRIANRQQAAAAVAADENEHHDRVSDMLPLLVGFKQRTNQQHRRAGRANEARQHCPHGHERRVGERVGLQVALDANAPADRVQREQQDDERHVFLKQCVFHNRPHKGAARRAHDVMSWKVSFQPRFVKQRIVRQRD